MSGLQATLFAILGTAPTSPVGAEVQRSANEARELRELRWSIEHDARSEREHRLTGGIVKVGVGALQTALGLYVLLGVPADVGTVDSSGILNTAAGAGFILDGTLALARRGPLESLVRDPAFANAFESTEGAAWIEQRLQKAARRGKIERRLAGSLSLIGAAAITGLGIANLADRDIRNKPAQAVLGAAEIGAALGFGANGIRLLVIASQAEHTLAMWEHRRRVASIRVVPTFGGMQVSGRF